MRTSSYPRIIFRVLLGLQGQHTRDTRILILRRFVLFPD